MAGVLIYKFASQYYSFVIADNSVYRAAKKELIRSGNEILWAKGRVALEQIENARETKDDLVARLNNGEKINPKYLKKELKVFF